MSTHKHARPGFVSRRYKSEEAHWGTPDTMAGTESGREGSAHRERGWGTAGTEGRRSAGQGEENDKILQHRNQSEGHTYVAVLRFQEGNQHCPSPFGLTQNAAGSAKVKKGNRLVLCHPLFGHSSLCGLQVQTL